MYFIPRTRMNRYVFCFLLTTLIPYQGVLHGENWLLNCLIKILRDRGTKSKTSNAMCHEKYNPFLKALGEERYFTNIESRTICNVKVVVRRMRLKIPTTLIPYRGVFHTENWVYNCLNKILREEPKARSQVESTTQKTINFLCPLREDRSFT